MRPAPSRDECMDSLLASEDGRARAVQRDVPASIMTSCQDEVWVGCGGWSHKLDANNDSDDRVLSILVL